MFAEALEALASLAVKAKSPHPLPSDERSVRWFADGKYGEQNLPPKPRDHKVGTLADLISLANRFKDLGRFAVVWHDSARVVLVLDDSEHRLERATFDLVPSEAFLRLASIRDHRETFDQRGFVRLLRVDLAGTLDPVVLLEPARNVTWEQSSSVQGSVTRAQESLGREVNSRVKAKAPIPESVVLQVKAYCTPGEDAPFPCRCLVEVDTTTGRFELLPVPDELEVIQEYAAISIRGRLGAGVAAGGLEDGIPYYRGKP